MRIKKCAGLLAAAVVFSATNRDFMLRDGDLLGTILSALEGLVRFLMRV